MAEATPQKETILARVSGTTLIANNSNNTANTTTARDMVGGRRNNRRVSCFDPSLMPTESIRKRELHSFSVHYSVGTAKWIATLARPNENGSAAAGPNSPADESKRRCVSFSFLTERDARKFAKAYSPPKLITGSKACFCCKKIFNNSKNRSSYHCRNCGCQICEKCSTRWGIRMIPKTFINAPSMPLTVRVCRSCDWLSNAFCMSLLHGKYENALSCYETGNVNLRSTFADIHKEAMFPIHCAVMGGNLDLVRWLVETHGCPISVKTDPKTGMFLSVQTSSSRTLIDLAMTGKPKIDILSYLVRKNLSVLDTKDPTLASKTLHILMTAGFQFEDKVLNKDTGEIESIKIVESCDASMASIEDACVICCEKPMNCCLIPCGHQMCCSDCGEHLSECPVCKKPSKVLRIYRM